MRTALLTALSVSIAVVAFLVVTWVGFFFLNPFVSGNPVIVRACPRITPDVLQQYRDYYGLDQPIYAQYSLWLIHGFSGQAGAPVEACLSSLQPSYSQSFQVAIIAWAVLTIVLVGILVALARRDKNSPSPSGDAPGNTNP